jgi:hypothetical protein
MVVSAFCLKNKNKKQDIREVLTRMDNKLRLILEKPVTSYMRNFENVENLIKRLSPHAIISTKMKELTGKESRRNESRASITNEFHPQ